MKKCPGFYERLLANKHPNHILVKEACHFLKKKNYTLEYYYFTPDLSESDHLLHKEDMGE
jgi:hypothetical protein